MERKGPARAIDEREVKEEEVEEEREEEEEEAMKSEGGIKLLFELLVTRLWRRSG